MEIEALNMKATIAQTTSKKYSLILSSRHITSKKTWSKDMNVKIFTQAITEEHKWSHCFNCRWTQAKDKPVKEERDKGLLELLQYADGVPQASYPQLLHALLPFQPLQNIGTLLYKENPTINTKLTLIKFLDNEKKLQYHPLKQD
jgi:hypothetical protein